MALSKRTPRGPCSSPPVLIKSHFCCPARSSSPLPPQTPAPNTRASPHADLAPDCHDPIEKWQLIKAYSSPHAPSVPAHTACPLPPRPAPPPVPEAHSLPPCQGLGSETPLFLSGILDFSFSTGPFPVNHQCAVVFFISKGADSCFFQQKPISVCFHRQPRFLECPPVLRDLLFSPQATPVRLVRPPSPRQLVSSR